MFKFGVPEKWKALPCEKQNFYMKAGVLGQTLLDIIDYGQTLSSLFMQLIKKMNAKLVSLVC